MKILDCTLRDGGYYTNWDFEESTTHTYFTSMENLPIDYIEIGYRSKPMSDYMGKYFYCPIYVIKSIKELSGKKLAIILNEKDVRAGDAEALLKPCQGLIDMVRIAMAPSNFLRALHLAKEVKSLGFELAFNVMYMSTWQNETAFFNNLPKAKGLPDYFYMVDSFGGSFPKQVKNTVELVRSNLDVKLGFHGHNNLELGLINTLTAIEEGVDIVDTTVTGMGRGAGNLSTELLLTVLNSTYQLPVDFNALASVVSEFESLRSQYHWGTNLPYMVSGANSLPQKQVMEWVSRRFYSINSMVRTLQNKKEGVEDNEKFPVFEPKDRVKKAIIVGGGATAANHAEAVDQILRGTSDDFCIIYASSKNAYAYRHVTVEQYFCLVGVEGSRLEKTFEDLGDFKGTCILPPFPREMGTYVPPEIMTQTRELGKINFVDNHRNNHTSIALQTSLDLGVKEVYLIGYDVYENDDLNSREHQLYLENQEIFDAAKTRLEGLYTFTPTRYKRLVMKSLYSMLK